MSPPARKPPALDRFLTWRMHRIGKLGDKGSAQAYSDELGITLGEGRCLAAIGQFEPLSVKNLAQFANLDKANASRSADALAQRGLVLKEGHTRDGRSIVLSLSPAGRALWRKTMAMIERRNEDIFGVLNERERLAFDKAIDKVLASLDSEA